MGGMGIMGGRGKAKKIAPWGAIFMGRGRYGSGDFVLLDVGQFYAELQGGVGRDGAA